MEASALVPNALQLQADAQLLLYKQEERVKLLERELQIQRRNLSHQTEKLNTYRKEFANLKATIKLKEKENEDLIQKLADFTLKNIRIEEREEPLVSYFSFYHLQDFKKIRFLLLKN